MRMLPRDGAKLVGGVRPGELRAEVGTFDDAHGCCVAVLNQVLAPAPGKERPVLKDFRAETVAKLVDKGFLVRKEFPEGAHPVTEVEFPAKGPGGRPVRRRYELKERC
jgi:hypothetical protein